MEVPLKRDVQVSVRREAASPSQVGRTQVQLSCLGVGTGTLSNVEGEAAVHSTLGHALTQGLRYFDTAPLYLNGDSERRLGGFIASQQRDSLTISTKVGRFPPDADVPLGSDSRKFDYSADATEASLEESLKRLQTSYLDLVVIHDLDVAMHEDFERAYGEAVEGAYSVLAEWKRRGTVRAVGVSTRQSEVAARFLGDTDIDCIMMAGSYTLLNHEPLEELLPLCQERGTSVIIASPFNSGILATGDLAATFEYHQPDEDIRNRVTALVEACNRYRVPLSAAALQFTLAHPAVSAAVVGNRSADELDRNIRSLESEIPSQLWMDLKADRLLPESAPVPS